MGTRAGSLCSLLGRAWIEGLLCARRCPGLRATSVTGHFACKETDRGGDMPGGYTVSL